MTYRTKTYIAGAWDEDNDAIDQLKQWNVGDRWKLSFKDAHEITSCRDASKSCTIKSSLKRRLDASKNFVLIVSSNTKTRRKGSCQYCPKYVWGHCLSGGSVDLRSFIEYECDYVAANIGKFTKIIALYNSISVDKELCPASIRNIAQHRAMKKINVGVTIPMIDWYYSNVVDAFN